MTSGTSEDAEVSVLSLAYNKDRSQRYGNEEGEARGLNLVGNRVEYVDKALQRITPIDKQRPYITSYDKNPFPKHPYSATSNYEDVTGMNIPS